MKAVESKVTVRYYEVGRQGFAHHSNYFNWFDVALEELIKKCGMSYAEIEDLGYFFATLSDKCKYYHPAVYGDELIVRLNVTDVSTIKVGFSYELIREKDATLIATGESSHVFVDKTFKPHPLKKVVPKLYNVIGDMV